jgi:hypothetical protein
MNFAFDHLLAAHDARLDDALAAVREQRRSGATEMLRMAADGVWRDIAELRRVRDQATELDRVREALSEFSVVEQIRRMVALDPWHQIMAVVRRAPGVHNEILAALELHRHQASYRKTLLEQLSAYWRNPARASVGARYLTPWFQALRVVKRTIPPRWIRSISFVRRALGFFGAAKVDGRNLP